MNVLQIYKRNRGRVRYIFVLAIAILLMLIALLATRQVHAQGCSLCRDAVSGAPPQQQAGFRHAIEVLGSGALLLFAAIGFTAWRSRDDTSDNESENNQ